jgi:Ca-activated chloride channel family protein
MGEVLFSALGLTPDASPDEIRHAYFEAARRLHPDSNPSPDAAAQFMSVQKAYDVLSNSERRLAHLISLAKNAEKPPVILQVQYSQDCLQSISEEQYVYALVEIINAEESKNQVPPNSNVCLVIDKSTSMAEKRIEMVKKAAYDLMKQLKTDDWVSIIAFSDRSEQIIPPTRVKKNLLSDSRIASIQTGGGTEILRGLEGAVEVLTKTGDEKGGRHLILLTDGHTYGDEEACYALAQRAGEKGIIISALGFGDAWNDSFLDRLTGLSGGTARLTSSLEDIKQFIREQVNTLGKIYARNLELRINNSVQSTLVDLYRIHPDSIPLPIEPQVRLGNLAYNGSIKILFEYKISPNLRTGDLIYLLNSSITMEIPTRLEPSCKIDLSLRRAVREEQEKSAPPREMVEAIEKLTLYRLQEKARAEEAAGDHSNASRHLKNLATRLFQKKGSDGLANLILNEAERIHGGEGYSPEAEKRIKYGTRALLLPPAKDEIK